MFWATRPGTEARKAEEELARERGTLDQMREPKLQDAFRALVPPQVREVVEGSGGTITDAIGPLPDGSGACTASFPLPKDHWLYAEHENVPPITMRMGTNDPRRKPAEERIRRAARFAVRAATMNGTVDDYDPDAIVQNMIVGLLGYHTPDGLSSGE
jgi:hypothetical protein